MQDRMSMSQNLLELLCIQAKAGRTIDLPGAGIAATFDQAMTILAHMKGTFGVLYLSQDGYDARELGLLAISGCTWSPEDRKALAGKLQTELRAKPLDPPKLKI